ncbi:MAG: phosphate signaling complex protein PhoU [Candidatus Saccharicenans sp.]|jgi:phosphate transport system protein|nr:phosphate signaling complex protein PhoU [Candidatus Saccharicenans sp.]
MAERVLDRELTKLKEKAAALIDKVNQAMNKTAELLHRQDLSLAETIISLEQESDRMESELQQKASTLMALHQPVARDLRFLLASMNLAHELERIADQCLNISQRLAEARPFLPLRWPPEIEEMVSRAEEMLRLATGAYLQNSEELASQAIGQDIFLDDLKSAVTSKYLDRINQQSIEPARAVVYILLSRHLEKIGDLCRNIAEESYYLIRGEFIKHLKLTDLYH